MRAVVEGTFVAVGSSNASSIGSSTIDSFGRRAALASFLRPLALLVAACPVLVAACPVLGPPLTGTPCEADADCVRKPGAAAGVDDDEVHHCELAATPTICLAGPATVAGRPNRAPVGTLTLVVGHADPANGTTFRARLVFADADGDRVSIKTPAVAFFDGDGTATLTVLDEIPSDADADVDAHDGVSVFEVDVTGAGGAVDDASPFVISDGVADSVVNVRVVLVDDPDLLVWTGAAGDDISSAASWQPAGPPTLDTPVVIDDAGSAPRVAGDASARDAFVVSGASLEVEGSLHVAHLALLGGSTAGDGEVLVDDGGAVGGAFPTLRIDAGLVQTHGALTAATVAGDGTLAVGAGDVVVVTGAVALGGLALDGKSALRAGGDIDVGALELTSTGSADDDVKTLVAAGAVTVSALTRTGAHPGALRVFLEANAQSAAEVAVALPDGVDSLVIGRATRARFASGAVGDVVVEGGIGVVAGGELDVDVLHIVRVPQPLPGSGAVVAAVCDLPDVDVALPDYLDCRERR